MRSCCSPSWWAARRANGILLGRDPDGPLETYRDQLDPLQPVSPTFTSIEAGEDDVELSVSVTVRGRAADRW